MSFIVMIAGLVALSFIMAPLIAIGLSTVPGIELVPTVGSFVAWGVENAWLLIPLGVGIFVLSSTRNLLWTLGGIVITAILVMIFLGSITI